MHNAALRKILVDLYPDASDARRVAADAGIDITGVNMEESITLVWYGILNEADNGNQISDLIAVAVDEYSGNNELLLAAWTYAQDVHSMRLVSSPHEEYYDMPDNERIARIERELDEVRKRLREIEMQIWRFSRNGAMQIDSKTIVTAVIVALVVLIAMILLETRL